jgi:hypothetical protein
MYPGDLRPSVEEWAELYADEARESYDKDKNEGLRWIKVSTLSKPETTSKVAANASLSQACNPGSTEPLGFARWASPELYSHQCSQPSSESPEKSEASKNMDKVTDTEFQKQFVEKTKTHRRKLFPDGKPHWCSDTSSAIPWAESKFLSGPTGI